MAHAWEHLVETSDRKVKVPPPWAASSRGPTPRAGQGGPGRAREGGLQSVFRVALCCQQEPGRLSPRSFPPLVPSPHPRLPNIGGCLRVPFGTQGGAKVIQVRVKQPPHPAPSLGLA